MPGEVQIRRAQQHEYDAIGRLVFDAIHSGASLYTPEQRRAWLPEPKAGPDWQKKLEEQAVWVGHSPEKGLIGVITLRPDGYVDLAFILADWQGRGLFGRLYAALEVHARDADLDRLWVHASLHAEPAFARYGFTRLRADPVDRAGETLMRFEMEKRLVNGG